MSIKCPVCEREINTESTTCPHCGFKLLGSTQPFEPFNVDADSIDNAPEAKKEAHLKVVRGPQTGISIDLESSPLTIGRNPQCDLFLNDMTVSRVHARLEKKDDVWMISDCNSYNGVWVNNRSVETGALFDGDVIQIGAFCLIYQQR